MKRDDNWHKNKKFTSVDRRKILLPVAVTVVVSFVFLLSGAETYDLSLLQQGLDSMTSSNMDIVFGIAYASDDETSRTEESDDGDQGKAFDVSNDNGNDDNADATHVRDDNDVTSLKDLPNGLKESDSDSDIQNSVTTVQDNLGSSELQHCIGCGESEIDNVGPIGGDDGLAYLSPVYTPGSPAEDGVGGAVDGGERVGPIGGDDEVGKQTPVFEIGKGEQNQAADSGNDNTESQELPIEQEEANQVGLSWADQDELQVEEHIQER